MLFPKTVLEVFVYIPTVKLIFYVLLVVWYLYVVSNHYSHSENLSAKRLEVLVSIPHTKYTIPHLTMAMIISSS